MATEKRLIYANALRETVITDYYEHFTGCHDTDQVALIDMVCDAIEDSPTVDAVEVVHGEWEPRKDVPGFVRCSVCHDCNIYDDWADRKKWNYCPNCGADMRERKDNHVL